MSRLGALARRAANTRAKWLVRNDEVTEAKRLQHRFKGELRPLDDLGWEREPEAEEFELTMAPRELRPIADHRPNASIGARSLRSTTNACARWWYVGFEVDAQLKNESRRDGA